MLAEQAEPKQTVCGLQVPAEDKQLEPAMRELVRHTLAEQGLLERIERRRAALADQLVTVLAETEETVRELREVNRKLERV